MRIRSGFGIGLLTLTLSALLSAPASAQVDTGTLSGTVKDESGGVLPGATVTITHEGQGLKLTSVGTGFGVELIVNVRPFDMPPPGAGLVTVIVTEPTLATSAAEI